MAGLVAFVVRPLVGWGTAQLFTLATPAFIATVLLWSCPGAPFGSSMVMTAKANIQTGAVLQVMMAAIGSITFAPTANALISAADLGEAVSLPVGDLIKTVAFL
jgi:BASS family bile acid:Na+ symporter